MNQTHVWKLPKLAALAIGMAALVQGQTSQPQDLNGRWAATIQEDGNVFEQF